MISHAMVGLATAVGALPVTTIQPGLQTLLVAAIGTALLLQSGLVAAMRTAVPLAAVTVLANPERALASAAASLPENGLLSRHAHPRGALDNGRESWQVRTECW
jgi:hypothetical protein